MQNAVSAFLLNLALVHDNSYQQEEENQEHKHHTPFDRFKAKHEAPNQVACARHQAPTKL